MNQNYNLNLIPGKVPISVHVKQYDTSLRNIIFTIYAGDSTFSIPSNSTVTVSGTKPDGNGFSYSCSFSGSTVTVPMQTQMTPLAGEIPCQLTIAQSGGVIGTASFILAVEPAALSSDTPVSETDLAMFQQLATQTQTEAASVANSTAQIAQNTSDIATNTAAITELNGKFSYSDVNGTTGTSQYAGYYYVDIPYPSTSGALVAASVISTTSNRPAFVGTIASGNLRVFTSVSETAVTVRCLFMRAS